MSTTILTLINRLHQTKNLNFCTELLKYAHSIKVQDGEIRGGEISLQNAYHFIDKFGLADGESMDERRRIVYLLKTVCRIQYFVCHLCNCHKNETKLTTRVQEFIQKTQLKPNQEMKCQILDQACSKQVTEQHAEGQDPHSADGGVVSKEADTPEEEGDSQEEVETQEKKAKTERKVEKESGSSSGGSPGTPGETGSTARSEASGSSPTSSPEIILISSESSDNTNQEEQSEAKHPKSNQCADQSDQCDKDGIAPGDMIDMSISSEEEEREVPYKEAQAPDKRENREDEEEGDSQEDGETQKEKKAKTERKVEKESGSSSGGSPGTPGETGSTARSEASGSSPTSSPEIILISSESSDNTNQEEQSEAKHPKSNQCADQSDQCDKDGIAPGDMIDMSISSAEEERDIRQSKEAQVLVVPDKRENQEIAEEEEGDSQEEADTNKEGETQIMASLHLMNQDKGSRSPNLLEHRIRVARTGEDLLQAFRAGGKSLHTKVLGEVEDAKKKELQNQRLEEQDIEEKIQELKVQIRSLSKQLEEFELVQREMRENRAAPSINRDDVITSCNAQVQKLYDLALGNPILQVKPGDSPTASLEIKMALRQIQKQLQEELNTQLL